jgi:hypothetical protein
MTEKAPDQPGMVPGKTLATPSEIAREAAIEAASALRTANQFPAAEVGGDESSLLYPPITPRRR